MPALVEVFSPYFRTIWLKILAMLLLMMISMGLFLCRETYQEFYGLTELAFGCVSVWLAVPRVLESPANWPLLLGAMSINVRGLDNLSQGRRKRLAQAKEAKIG